jgi:hypothetical protein
MYDERLNAYVCVCEKQVKKGNPATPPQEEARKKELH